MMGVPRSTPPCSAAALRAILRYDAETGEFIWRRNNKAAGTVAADGYIHIKIDGRVCKAHRLAWLYAHGTWPEAEVDHRDRDRANNRLSNLREATTAQNRVNTISASGGAAKLPSGRWQAQIGHQRRRIYLGAFDTREEARAAYSEAAAVLFGEFAPALQSIRTSSFLVGPRPSTTTEGETR